jgi:hypothetical protein
MRPIIVSAAHLLRIVQPPTPLFNDQYNSIDHQATVKRRRPNNQGHDDDYNASPFDMATTCEATGTVDNIREADPTLASQLSRPLYDINASGANDRNHRYAFNPPNCDCGKHVFGSGTVEADLQHGGVAFVDVAAIHPRPDDPTMAMIRESVAGFDKLTTILSLDHAAYVNQVPSLVADCKATIAVFAEYLKIPVAERVGDPPLSSAIGQDTHGKKHVLRWILNVTCASHSELERTEELPYTVDLSQFPDVREAVMGLLMVESMTRRDHFVPISEVELMWGSRHRQMQAKHMDGSEQGVWAFLWRILAEPVKSSWHSSARLISPARPVFYTATPTPHSRRQPSDWLASVDAGNPT